MLDMEQIVPYNIIVTFENSIRKSIIEFSDGLSG